MSSSSNQATIRRGQDPGAQHSGVQNYGLQGMDQRTLARASAPEKQKGFLDKIGQSFREWGYAVDLYNWRLTGRHPLKVERVIDDIRPAAPDQGEGLINAILDAKDQAAEANKYWAGKIDGLAPDHSFSFLTHLSATREQLAARAVTTALTDAWCDRYLTWQAGVWSGPMCAHRLVNWFANVPLVLASTDLVYRSRVLLAVARQMRHLPRVIKDIHRLKDHVAAGAALALAGLLLPNATSQRDKGYRVLSQSINNLIRADGTPVTQNNNDLIDALFLLALVRGAAEKAQVVFPSDLQSALDRSGPYLKALYHNGDAPVRFSAGVPLSRADMASLLDQVGSTGAEGSSFPHGGIYRVAASGTVIMANAAPGVRGLASTSAAAETGAIEISSSGDLLITSMGPTCLPDFAHVARASAAQSALVLDNRHVTEILPNGELGPGVDRTSVKRRSRRDGEEISITHDGYARRLGYSVNRTLTLSRDGLVITGTENVTPVRKKTISAPMDIWFHLHPSLKARETKEGDIILLTPTKKLWVFKIEGGEGDSLSLENSISFVDPNTPQATMVLHVARPDIARTSSALTWHLTRRE